MLSGIAATGSSSSTCAITQNTACLSSCRSTGAEPTLSLAALSAPGLARACCLSRYDLHIWLPVIADADNP